MPRKGPPAKGRQFNRNNKHSKNNKFFKHGVNKKKNNPEVPKFIKNFKYSQRNKETEDALKRQTMIEQKYKRRNEAFQNRHLKKDLEAFEEPEDVNYYEQLINSLGHGRKSQTAESSDEDDEEDEIEEEEIEEDENDEEGTLDKDMDEDDEDDAWSDMSDDDENTEEGLNLGPEERNNNNKDNQSKHALPVAEDLNESESEDTEPTELDVEPNAENDPYLECYKYDISTALYDVVQQDTASIYSFNKSRTWPVLGKISIEIPTTNMGNKGDLKPETTLLSGGTERFASEGKEPLLVHSKHATLDDIFIKTKLQKYLTHANRSSTEKCADNGPLTAVQWELFSLFHHYQDVYLNGRSIHNSEEIRFAYALHALNHVLKNRSEVIRNNAAISRQEADMEQRQRDQGLVRPKVLIVVPLKDAAYRIINMMVDLLVPDEKKGGKVINHKRFVEEFSGDELTFSKTNPKPDDYQHTFQGNTDDNFRIGLALTKKCVKLYADFYGSDVIVASPLGLRMIIGGPGDAERDFDFLSSIEVLVLDQLEVMFAQNWDHVLHIFDHLHLHPQSRANTDFSRVRSWALNGWTKFYRQTILVASHDQPEFRSIFNSRCRNFRGRIKQTPVIHIGCIRHCAVQIPQTFHRIEVASIEGSFDARFAYFTNTILPQFTAASMAHCMIYVPSYFDFVRLRNHFKAEVSATTVQVCEYTKEGKVARARDMFYHSGAHFLLYTERAHFFRRPQIKGIRHLIFYQPPTWPHFYPEMVNLMQDAYQNARDGLDHNMSVTVLYTKYDILQLTGILSTATAKELVAATKRTHLFVTEKQ